jgi:predicted DNA-binding antitoxin AbrB/MazE fold protein
MTQKVDAIYTGGVLKPTRDLCLRENQRVRLIVETIEEPNRDRAAAIARLKAGIASMRFFSEAGLPTREKLHDRR